MELRRLLPLSLLPGSGSSESEGAEPSFSVENIVRNTLVFVAG